MHRSGWYLPSLTAAVTIAYMEAVRRREIWCPRYEEVRLRPCLVPPPTKQLLEWIGAALENISKKFPDANHPKTHGFDGRRLPDA